MPPSDSTQERCHVTWLRNWLLCLFFLSCNQPSPDIKIDSTYANCNFPQYYNGDTTAHHSGQEGTWDSGFQLRALSPQAQGELCGLEHCWAPVFKSIPEPITKSQHETIISRTHYDWNQIRYSNIRVNHVKVIKKSPIHLPTSNKSKNRKEINSGNKEKKIDKLYYVKI